MSNLAAVLKGEVSRLVRKEVRGNVTGLRKTMSQHHKSVAEMKRRLSELERKITLLEKLLPRDVPSGLPVQKDGAGKFSPKGLRSHRKRLRLSAAEYGNLIGVTGQTVYKWESKKGRPRQQQLASLLAVRGMGRREALTRLEQFSADGKKK